MSKSVGKMSLGADTTNKPNIGKTGAIKSTTPSSGAQHSFLPGAKAASNAGVSRPSPKMKSGQTSGPGRQHPFLPKSY